MRVAVASRKSWNRAVAHSNVKYAAWGFAAFVRWREAFATMVVKQRVLKGRAMRGVKVLGIKVAIAGAHWRRKLLRKTLGRWRWRRGHFAFLVDNCSRRLLLKRCFGAWGRCEREGRRSRWIKKLVDTKRRSTSSIENNNYSSSSSSSWSKINSKTTEEYFEDKKGSMRNEVDAFGEGRVNRAGSYAEIANNTTERRRAFTDK